MVVYSVRNDHALRRKSIGEELLGKLVLPSLKIFGMGIHSVAGSSRHLASAWGHNCVGFFGVSIGWEMGEICKSMDKG